jgi:hypothetical protein
MVTQKQIDELEDRIRKDLHSSDQRARVYEDFLNNRIKSLEHNMEERFDRLVE